MVVRECRLGAERLGGVDCEGERLLVLFFAAFGPVDQWRGSSCDAFGSFAIGPFCSVAALGPFTSGDAIGPFCSSAALGPFTSGDALGPFCSSAALGPVTSCCEVSDSAATVAYAFARRRARACGWRDALHHGSQEL